MVEQFELDKLVVLQLNYFSRHIDKCDIAKYFQDTYLNPSEPNQGYKLDIMDMVILPLYSDFWYLIVANFRESKFEVICPNDELEKAHALAKSAIWNFKRTFKLAYPRSLRVNIYDMDITVHSISHSSKDCDSGIYVMKTIQTYDGKSHPFFKPDDALRENLTYYMVAHRYNEKHNPKVQAIIKKYGGNSNNASIFR